MIWAEKQEKQVGSSSYQSSLGGNMLIDGSKNWGPRPFKFFNIRLEDEAFLLNLYDTWKNSACSSFFDRIKEVKFFAKHWNKNVFGDINVNISKVEKDQDEVDRLNLGEDHKHSIGLRLEELYRVRSGMLCQKARALWSLKGEKNTRFFHRAIARRKL